MSSSALADFYETFNAAPGNYPAGSFHHYIDVDDGRCYKEIVFDPEYITHNNGSGTNISGINVHFANGSVKTINRTIYLHPVGAPWGEPEYVLTFNRKRKIDYIEVVAASATASHSKLDIYGQSVRCKNQGGGTKNGRITLPPHQAGTGTVRLNKQRASKIVIESEYITPNNGSGSYVYYVDVTFGNGNTRRLFSGNSFLHPHGGSVHAPSAKTRMVVSLRKPRNIVSVQVTGVSQSSSHSLINVKVK